MTQSGTAHTAIVDVHVSEVFGNAARFADLAFDEELDPDTGKTVAVVSDISALDTRLVFNDAETSNDDGSGRVRMIGSGVFRLGGGNGYAGGTEISLGTLVAASGAALGGSGGLVIFSGGDLRISGADDGTAVRGLILDEQGGSCLWQSRPGDSGHQRR